jgi:hypothetical protein
MITLIDSLSFSEFTRSKLIQRKSSLLIGATEASRVNEKIKNISTEGRTQANGVVEICCT